MFAIGRLRGWTLHSASRPDEGPQSECLKESSFRLLIKAHALASLRNLLIQPLRCTTTPRVSPLLRRNWTVKPTAAIPATSLFFHALRSSALVQATSALAGEEVIFCSKWPIYGVNLWPNYGFMNISYASNGQKDWNIAGKQKRG